MWITRKTDYATRAVLALAIEDTGRAINLLQLAARTPGPRSRGRPATCRSHARWKWGAPCETPGRRYATPQSPSSKEPTLAHWPAVPADPGLPALPQPARTSRNGEPG